jgi:glucose-6-phosphate 1-dehydrogenase
MYRNPNEKDLSSIMVIFGGTGDLTHRKLMPAFYNLVHDGLLPENFAIVSIGRREKSTEKYREEVLESLKRFSRNRIEEQKWKRLEQIIFYETFDFAEIEGYFRLKQRLDELDDTFGTKGNRAFYLAVAPEHFETIVRRLDESGLAGNGGSWNRLVIEKPFGKDLATARSLNNSLLKVYREEEIFRIDHYLGKDMIQNIMVLRFSNFMFEQLWNSKCIDNIQISLLEKDGVGSRGGYYENSGAIRDMLQSHIIQILSLVAMEPPINLTTEAIKNEKLKVIRSIEELSPEILRKNVVLGQYGAGFIDGRPVPAYRDEEKVAKDSMTETFVALKLHIENFRWAGTPFYIRTGKSLGKTSAEIVIQMKSMPNILYFKDRHTQIPNLLVIRIQPTVGVSFRFNTKDFESHSNIVQQNMDFSHIDSSQGNTPEAYERLILDVLRGDSTLFSRWDEVEASWKIADRIIEYREQNPFDFPNYNAGTTGPIKAFELLARDGREWWSL